MKLTTKEIKKLIKEEIKKVLNESLESNQINIHAFTRLEDDIPDSIPLVYGNKLMEAYQTGAAHVLYEYFGETIDEKIIEKLIALVNDSVEELCVGESGKQAQELIKSLDPKFKGIPVGDIRFDDDVGYCNIQVTLGSNGLVIVSGEEDIDDEGFIEMDLGTYGMMPHIDDISIMNPSGRLFDVYFRNLDIGSGGYGNQDIQGSIDVNIRKIINDVNNGNLGLDINDKRGEPMYVVKRTYV